MAPFPVSSFFTAAAAAALLGTAPLSFAFTSPFVSTRSAERNINFSFTSTGRSYKTSWGTGGTATKTTARDDQEGDAAGATSVAATAGGGVADAVVSRRDFFTSLGTAAFGGGAILGAMLTTPEEAGANGMLDFPPARLNNRYFLIRSGQGESDKEGRIQSHPIDKLHMDNRLTNQGEEEAQRAAGVLSALGVTDPFIWADISSRAQDTARIMAQELDIRQERVMPEYSFLEPRGMGIFDGKEAAAILPEVYKEDANDLLWRPPPNTDGTPNESVNDVFVRVRQLMSKLETQYQGEDVVIIGADSDCLSVLQSFVLGEELGKHSKYYLRPGEGRQLRTSIDTEVGYQDRRRAKKNPVAGDGMEVATITTGAVAAPPPTTAALAPPAS